MPKEESIGVQIPEVLLPAEGIDLNKWAVIACDQFTSQPEYWEQVAQIVGGSPSTYHMILPEIFLDSPEEAPHIQSAQANMYKYLAEGMFRSIKGLIYIERIVKAKTRRGLVICLDLEAYNFNKGSQTLIRATEETIIERLPPRIRIRKDAPLELPHILVLYDDPQHTVLAPVLEKRTELEVCYDFDLMMGSGHLTGRSVNEPITINQVLNALTKLADPKHFSEKYNVPPEMKPLLFAMGDGNHSLATAKAIWEEIKPHVEMDHPARYALVEIENIHDPALEFEPIHRLVFNIPTDIKKAMFDYYGERIKIQPMPTLEQLITAVDSQTEPNHSLGMLSSEGLSLIEIAAPESNLPVGTLQAFLDDYLKSNPSTKIDYVHGIKILDDLGTKPGNAGFYLPAMDKNDLFKTVILDGALPRKTFSMGEAKEKRFYMECRRIQSAN